MKCFRATHITLRNGSKVCWFGNKNEAQQWTESAASETSGGCGSSVETCEVELRKPALIEFLNKIQPTTWEE